MHTLTSYAPVELAGKGMPVMMLTDLENQTSSQKVTKGEPKVGKKKIQWTEYNIYFWLQET